MECRGTKGSKKTRKVGQGCRRRPRDATPKEDTHTLSCKKEAREVHIE